MRRTFPRPAVCVLPLSFLLLYPSCRVIPRGVPGAEYAVIRMQNGQSLGVEKKRILAYQDPNPKPPIVRPSPPIDTTHPTIDQWIKNPSIPDGQVEEVLVGLLPPKDPANSKTYLSSFEEELVRLGSQYIRRYDSIYTFSLKLPVRALRGQLRDDPRIRYIEPNRVPLTLDMIPSQGLPGTTCKGFDGYSSPSPGVVKIQTIEARMNLQLFANPPAAAIALLDSGVNDHPLIPAAQLVRHDCLNPPCTASGGNDSCANHGTPDTGILIATGTGGLPHGILQGATVHSFKVFEGSGGPGSCSADGNAIATVEALNSGVAGVGPAIDVILTETLIPGSANSSVAVAVDSAFDAGYPVIVAANPTLTLLAPSNAHKGFPIASTNQLLSYTEDKRIVPAVWADSGSETLSGSTSPLCKHDGASGAAPYAAAVAAKLRHLLKSNMQPDAPGNVYALILALAEVHFTGKRVLYLPASGQYLTGSFDIAQGGEAYAEIDVAAGEQLRAAIWWPESAANATGTEIHNEIHLELGKPSGHSAGKADHKTSVFQNKVVVLPLETGLWRIKVAGANIVAGPQRVYWAAFAGN